MTKYWNRNQVARDIGAKPDVIRRLEEEGRITPTIKAGKGSTSGIFYDKEGLEEVRRVYRDVIAEKMRSPESPPERPAAKLATLDLAPLLSVVQDMRSDGSFNHEIQRQQHAALMALLETLLREVRALRAVWEGAPPPNG